MNFDWIPFCCFFSHRDRVLFFYILSGTWLSNQKVRKPFAFRVFDCHFMILPVKIKKKCLDTNGDALHLFALEEENVGWGKKIKNLTFQISIVVHLVARITDPAQRFCSCEIGKKKKKNPKMKYRNTFKRKRNVSIRANEKQQIILIIIWNLAHIQQACHLSIIFKNFRCAVEKKELNPSRGRQRQRCNIAKMKNKNRSKMTSRI